MGFFKDLKHYLKANYAKNESSNSNQNDFDPIWIIIEAKGLKLVNQTKDLQIINWSEVIDITFFRNKLVLDTFSGNAITLPSSYFGWYQLIQSIPSQFISFDNAAAQTLINGLKGCKICGLLAVETNSCLSCQSEIWLPRLRLEWPNEVEYIKTHQLHFFTPFEPDEAIDINNRPKDGFKSDPNWEVLVSQEAIKNQHFEDSNETNKTSR